MLSSRAWGDYPILGQHLKEFAQANCGLWEIVIKYLPWGLGDRLDLLHFKSIIKRKTIYFLYWSPSIQPGSDTWKNFCDLDPLQSIWPSTLSWLRRSAYKRLSQQTPLQKKEISLMPCKAQGIHLVCKRLSARGGCSQCCWTWVVKWI